MAYNVIWTRRALRQLSALLRAARDQAAVSDASVEVQRRLAADPLNEGEDRDRGRRILFVPPIAVVYRVNDNTRTVHVVSAGWSGKPV
jgi:mRNA-degrading endonuclease RelE of RelBE toxin-antitoxin system